MTRRTACLAGLTAAALAVLAVAPFVGMHGITPRQTAAGGLHADIFWNLRVPRVGVSFLAGAALAAAGMAFQALLRNPLATPFTLGVASGASLGSALYTFAGISFALPGLPGASCAALAGALCAIALLYGLTRAAGGFSTATLLLAGVAISFFFSSLILFLQYLSDFTQTFRIVRWLMGGLDVHGGDAVWSLAPFTAAGAAILFMLSGELNLLAAGDDIAASRGVDVGHARRLTFFATSLMVGGVVAVCGPIGFIGMIAPHACRLLVGHDHRWLLPASLLAGGTLLTCCDTIARTVIAPAEIPVGVVTALLGGPFFLWLLLATQTRAPR